MMMMRGTDSINDKAKLKNYKKLKQIKLMMMKQGLIVKMKKKILKGLMMRGADSTSGRGRCSKSH